MGRDGEGLLACLSLWEEVSNKDGKGRARGECRSGWVRHIDAVLCYGQGHVDTALVLVSLRERRTAVSGIQHRRTSHGEENLIGLVSSGRTSFPPKAAILQSVNVDPTLPETG